jgi:hypothetical protein
MIPNPNPHLTDTVTDDETDPRAIHRQDIPGGAWLGPLANALFYLLTGAGLALMSVAAWLGWKPWRNLWPILLVVGLALPARAWDQSAGVPAPGSDFTIGPALLVKIAIAAGISYGSYKAVVYIHGAFTHAITNISNSRSNYNWLVTQSFERTFGQWEFPDQAAPAGAGHNVALLTSEDLVHWTQLLVRALDAEREETIVLPLPASRQRFFRTVIY